MREWENSKANPLKKSNKNLTRELEKSYTKYKGELKIFMRKLRNLFLLVLASLSLSGCGGSRELTFKEVEEKMEYVLMSESVKIEFYSIDKYGKYYYGENEYPFFRFKARIDENGNFVNYVVVTSEQYFSALRSDNAYGE